MAPRPTILVIDDQWGRANDPMILDHYGHLPFRWILESAAENGGGYSSEKALATASQIRPSAILLDIAFDRQELLGVEILERLRSAFPILPIIIFTGLESAENRELVIRCMELGASEYLEKAPSAAQMKSVIDVYTGGVPDQALYGNSEVMRRLRAEIARISFSGNTNVLIYGESGTGKELVAAALHRQGVRSEGPFVAKNCAHSDSQLLESELFGHKKGAFTGATGGRAGLIAEADGGVLFLDEVADIPLDLQAKLLRVLETRSFRPLGQNAEVRSDFQLICATNQSPVDLEKTKRLRTDFYYRIATITVSVPALRDRPKDIPILADLFLRRFKEHGAAGYPGEIFSERVLGQMLRHSWPGNVRELRNFVERSLLLSRERVMDLDLSDSLGLVTSPESDLLRNGLPQESNNWAKTRLVAELQLCLEAKRRIQAYKGEQWKAEFMRLMYPECRAANAKGFTDLIKRLTHGPWGDPDWRENPELLELIQELNH